MRIELLCTGDEILTGKTVNTNYSYMARRLSESGLGVSWGTTVGDDRQDLITAMQQASVRADAVIVNGGLGPTVDDLSQEAAAEAAGVGLELDRAWLKRVEAYYSKRGRVMPPTNRKQAMLPAGSVVLDNPVGTACGFRVNIGGTPFFFTPGVPAEMRKMLDDIVIPQLRTLSGIRTVSRVKRFHTFGIGESRADQILQAVQGLAADGVAKLGFQSHYPQLETKLLVHAADAVELARKLEPVEAEVRRRLENYIVAEDDQTLEQRILDALRIKGGSLATLEMFTGGDISSRLQRVRDSGHLIRCSVVSQDLIQLAEAAGLDFRDSAEAQDCRTAVALAKGMKSRSGSTHALAVLVSVSFKPDMAEAQGRIYIGIVDESGAVTREATLVGSEWWIRLGAMELGLDCLRRRLYGQPVDQRIDFEIR